MNLLLPGVSVVVSVCVAMVAIAARSPSPSPMTVREADVHGRPGWVIENGAVHLALLRGGGHIGEVRLLSDDPRLAISPLFVPAGNGYMGHLVCFPHYGPASAEERQQGLRGHGEAGSVDWQQTKPPRIDATGVSFFYGADLPKTQYRIERTVSINAGEAIVRVDETVENLAVYDRPYNYQQHATFGAPFVVPDRTVLDMSGTKAMSDPRRTAGGQWATGREFDWPRAPKTDGSTISLREFHAVPNRDGSEGQVYTPVLADPSRDLAWFTLYTVDAPLLVGYVFSRADHPWIVDWQNQPRADSSAGTARGIEFGTSPFDEGLRKSVERQTMFGASTYRWIGSRQKLSTSFTLFLTKIPSGFAGVQDLSARDGRIVITERDTRRELPVQ
jgi:hypothetical protein